MLQNSILKAHEQAGHWDIAIVIPTLNEEESIGKVIDEIKASVNGLSYRILVVDGHSKDRTREIASSNGAEVILQWTRRYGDALRNGFLHVYKRWNATCTVMMDADFTYNPGDIKSLVAPILQGTADMVIGDRLVKLEPGAMTRTNRIGNRILSGFARATLGLTLHDT